MNEKNTRSCGNDGRALSRNLVDRIAGEPYRAHGVPVPESTAASTLAALSALSALFGDLEVRRVIWLGDLLRAREGQQPIVLDAVFAWRCRHAAVEMLLVRATMTRAPTTRPRSWPSRLSTSLTPAGHSPPVTIRNVCPA